MSQPQTAAPAEGPLLAPEGQGVAFVELFFDLVFVFALTEVTALAVERLDWEGAAKSLLIFWMVWWAWTQWTWALNASNTDHRFLRLTTLVATAVAFLMAASVEQAFEGDRGLWFAVPYVAVRALGMGIYFVVARYDTEQLIAIRRFTIASAPAMLLVIVGGFADADVRGWWWLAAVVLDVAATAVAATFEDLGLRTAHFAERHGLFVIIALGESLIIVGIIVADGERTGEILRVALGAVVVTSLLWWTYFGWLKDALEAHLEREPSDNVVLLARDVYSLLHFLWVGGVIGVAVAFEAMALHPGEHLEPGSMLALGGGLALFVGSGVLAWLRTARRLLWPRLGVLALLSAALYLVRNEEPIVVLSVVAVGLFVITAIEELRAPAEAVSA